jgi:hypothetical protein
MPRERHTMPALLRLLPACFYLWSVATAMADPPRQLMWADLVPKHSSVTENPFARLTHDQLTALAEVAAVRERRARGDNTLTPAEMSGEQSTTRKLQQQGLDVDALLTKRKEIADQKRGQLQAVNAGLEGQTVKLPGYMLPLEITGKKVSEFLLVPWVGACIHTPPPPPNQIVHVIPDSPFEMPGMFAPVWVTGKMSTGASKKSLFMIDGTSEIDIGYTLRASRVEIYQQ